MNVTLALRVVVHAINTDAHPLIPPGYRWAVHAGTDWADLGSCLNAGWCPTSQEAAIAGEAAALVGARVARLLGVLVDPGTTYLDHDPITHGNDRVDSFQMEH